MKGLDDDILKITLIMAHLLRYKTQGETTALLNILRIIIDTVKLKNSWGKTVPYLDP